MKAINKMIKNIIKYNPDANKDKIKEAYFLAKKLHLNQQRKSGEDFINHPLEVTRILVDLGMDTTTIIAALLHDAVEDTNVSLTQIKRPFSQEVADLIDGVTKLGKIEFKTEEEQQAETLRKMLLAMTKDVRVIIIKLADRTHNMRTINALEPEKRKQKARETLDVYAPLAHRLGIYSIKWELEDLSFAVLENKKYNQIMKMVAESRNAREKYIEKVKKAISSRLKEANVKFEISGRPKHFYSIYQKMVKRGKEFNEIYDLMALRIIVENVRDCYAALGIIHSIWKPIPGRFKDYIAMPKFNLYQSLHTTVIGPEGKPLEIQIRSTLMHRTADYGIAAHWRYKEGVKNDIEFEERLSWLRQMLEWQSDLKDPKEFMEALKIDLFEDEVFVFSPKGDVYSLPSGSTPIDFAYSIHTDVGHSCVGAKVNGRIVPLEYELINGDQIEILTSKSSSGPSRDWLNIVKTSRARNKIRQYFSKERRESLEQVGKDELYKIMRRKGFILKARSQQNVLKEIAAGFNFNSVDDLYSSIGAGKTSPQQVATKLINLMTHPDEREIEEEDYEEYIAKQKETSTTGIKVKGVEDVLVRLARCCNPVPGDKIVGFITRGRGVSVHRNECTNIVGLKEEKDRFIEVSWDKKVAKSFPVEIKVESIDRKKLLRDISTIISDAGVNILNASVVTSKDKIAILRFVFEISDMEHLKSILNTINNVDTVISTYRVMPGQRS